jgi:hypothetical protein
MFRRVLFWVVMLLPNVIYAQNFDSVMRAGGNNYKAIIRNAEAYFTQYGTKGTGYNQYMRWKAMVAPNIMDDGTVPDMDQLNNDAYTAFVAANPPLQGEAGILAGVPAWTPLGQVNPTIPAGRNQNGSGSTRCIEWQGNNMWVGTPGGGIWYGQFVSGTTYNWTPRADGIPNLAITDIEIAPTNANIMYAITGAVGNASGYRSTGVIKSVDGGASWFFTGLTFPENALERGYRLLVNPNNANMVWAATTTGLWRTTDGGNTWALCTFFTTVGGSQSNMMGTFFEILYRPGSTTVMYATGPGFFYRSNDGGATFLRVNRTDAGLPTSGGTRIQMAVAPTNVAVVYLLYANGNSQQGVYRSGDGGNTFTAQNTTTNMLGTQAWRNIAISVSPSNSNHLYAGGLDVYKSTDAGATWTQISDWSTTDINQYSHADIFELYTTSDFVFAATDGGVFRLTRSNDTWQQLHRNMQIAQTYRMAVDPSSNASFVVMGNQDCGTYVNTGSAYTNILGADGMTPVINPGNTQVLYVSTQNGGIFRTNDRGATTPTGIFSTDAANGLCSCGESSSWIAPVRLRPGNNTHIYVGYESVWFSTNSGASGWTRIAPAFTNPIISIEFAPGNNSVLYATDGAALARYNFSNNAWTRTVINGNLPANTNISRIAVDPNDANHVLLSVAGYTATRKIFETFNANNAAPNWVNITRNLPNVPINTIVIDNNAANTIYIGSDIGVFVTNDNRVNWIMYTNGLPATRVYDLQINNAISPARIYAATFGRGIYWSEKYTGCQGSAVTLTGTVDGFRYTETSANIISTQLVQGGEGTSVGYNSGTYITLNPGFRAVSGTRFEAYIQGCTTNNNPPKPLGTDLQQTNNNDK